MLYQMNHLVLHFASLARSRTWTLDHLTEQVIKPLLGVYSQLDVYLHTYNIETFSSIRNNETEVPISVGRSIELLVSALQQLKEPGGKVRIRKINISDPHEADISFHPLTYYLERGDPWRNRGVSLFYLLRQLYSLDQVTKLWENMKDPLMPDNEYYQSIVYLRPDLIYYQKLDISSTVLREKLRTSKETSCLNENNTLSIPHFDRHKGLNDRFAIGCPSVMRTYGHRMHDIDGYFKRYPNATLWAEPFLYKLMLEMHGVQYRKMKNFVFSRVRAGGNY